MASSLKDLEGWQIVNTDDRGNIIDETSRGRRSRKGRTFQDTYLQRVSDGLSFRHGDSVIAHDHVTNTFSIYLINEIRQNTLNNVVEIWAFSYLRWFELKPERYFRQFNPSILTQDYSSTELYNKLFDDIDNNEIYLTAELTVISLKDFSGMANIVNEADYFKSGRGKENEDFIVNFICEPTGENFVKIDIVKELKLIKNMEPKQSDDHLKKLSTQKLHFSSVHKTEPSGKIQSASNIFPTTKTIHTLNSEKDDDRLSSTFVTSRKSPNISLVINNKEDQSSAPKENSYIDDTQNIQNEREEEDTDNPNLAHTFVREGSCSSSELSQVLETTSETEDNSNDSNQTNIETHNSFEEEMEYTPVYDSKIVDGSKKRKIQQSANNESKIPKSNIPANSDEQIDILKTIPEFQHDNLIRSEIQKHQQTEPQVEVQTKAQSQTETQSHQTNNKVTHIDDPGISSNTFHMIENRYNQILEKIRSYDQVLNNNDRIQTVNQRNEKQEHIDKTAGLIDMLSPYRGVRATPNQLTTDRRRKIIEQNIQYSSLHLADLYQILSRNLINHKSVFLFLHGNIMILQEIILQDVLKRLKFLQYQNTLPSFETIHLNINSPTNPYNIADELTKQLSDLSERKAVGSLLDFLRNVLQSRKKYYIIIIHNIDNLLVGEMASSNFDLLESLMKITNAGISVVGISEQPHDMLPLSPQFTSSDQWKSFNFLNYPMDMFHIMLYTTLQNELYGTFFVKYNPSSQTICMYNKDSIILDNNSILDEAEREAVQNGYTVRKVYPKKKDIDAIINLLGEKRVTYSQLIVIYKKALRLVKENYYNDLIHKAVPLSSHVFIGYDDIKSALMSNRWTTVDISSIKYLPTISIVLLAFIVDYYGQNNLEASQIVNFFNIQNDFVQYIKKSEAFPATNTIKTTLYYKTEDASKILTLINWSSILEDLQEKGIIQIASSAFQNNILNFNLEYNVQDIKEAVNETVNERLISELNG